MENMTSKELKAMAKKLSVKNWWNLKKAELIAEIQKIQNSINECDEPDYFEQIQIAELEVAEEDAQTEDATESTLVEVDNKNIVDKSENSEIQKASEGVSETPESTETLEPNNLSANDEKAHTTHSEPSNQKQYAAWVKDRETKELTKVFGKADSREAFYLSIKTKYRVRLITMNPEKIDEECEQWEIRHARNKKIKNEKYAVDKEKAKKINMSVTKYRKEVKNK